MQEAIIATITETEYLEIERSSEIKHEYYRGEMFAMAGASRNHNVIVANVIRELGVQLIDAQCTVYPSDMRLKIQEADKFVYPDVMVVCGEERFLDDRQDTILNPTVIVEILSDSTEAYDRGSKFAHYRRLDSLKEYVLISQTEQRIEKFLRNESGYWLLSETDENIPEIILESIDCKLDLAKVYLKVAPPG